jgi:hypothetical protein
MRRLLDPYLLARVALLALFLFSLHQIREMRSPSKSTWARHLAEGKDPTVAEHVEVGMWYGAATRAAVAAAMLVISFAWRRKAVEGSEQPMRLGGTPMRPVVFWTGVGVIVAGAAAMRLPRMTQSFWVDEADAVATYVHGQFRPIKKKDPQGALYFEDVPWGHTFYSARHGPNNHVLFSVASRLCLRAWQKETDHEDFEFTEWPLRVPSLIAGLGSLVALPCLLRRWGASATGLLASAFMAVHPWHVRYSTEARGYALALLFLPLVLLTLTLTLEKPCWWRWLMFALMEFLLMASWAGAAYPLVFINLAMVGIMMLRSARWVLVTRWLTVSLLAAAAFISLYAPQVPQIKRYNETHQWMKGGPMDAAWFHNIVASPLTGVPYHGPRSGEPIYVSWQRLLQDSPALTGIGFGLIVLSSIVGLVALWHRQREIAALVSAVLVAAVVAVLHFKFVIGDELRTWYLLFTLPGLSICVATGLMAITRLASREVSSVRLQPGVAATLLAVIAVALWPMNQALMAHTPEDFKGVMAMTRNKHETFVAKGRAQVFTCWLWRYAALYDPRGEIHVRDAASLRQRMAEARAANSTLFIIVGYRELAELQDADMLRLLDDPGAFEKTALFPGYEPLHTLEVFQMKPPPLAGG